MSKRNFPFYHQLDAMDCGPTCLRMIARHYGRHYSLQTLRAKGHLTREGVSLLGISHAAEEIGFRTLGVKVDYQKLVQEAPLPAIAHWQQNHFVVIHKIQGGRIHVADPAQGKVSYTKAEFLNAWASEKTAEKQQGILLLLETTPEFYQAEGEKLNRRRLGFLWRYLRPYQKYLFQLIIGLVLGSLLQLIFPFLTQSVVDFGIGTRNLSFIYLILAAQLMLFFSRTAVEVIRSWILLHLSTRINISIISDFLIKLMKLPIGFFDTKMTGDLMQRINDHHRIEAFLTNSTLNTLFSLFNLLIFSIVLLIYSVPIFFIFVLGSFCYLAWVFIFLRKRRSLDFKSFDKLAANQSKIIQLIHGMQEIKLNHIERQKRWEWESLQAALFRINIKRLALSQYQQAGSSFFNEIKNILITFYAAKEVIDGSMTLGMMLAISYILGQLNAPLSQLIGFIQSAQDASISLERLGEIHEMSEEEGADSMFMDHLPARKGLQLEDLSFHYAGPDSPRVLDKLSLTIPEGKLTAIVGTSGSGKTTLLKLLLKFYTPSGGIISVDKVPLSQVRHSQWRSQCGVVMQEGFIFSDTIAHNIALHEPIDHARLLQAVHTANIQPFIESLPLGYHTKIGQEGVGLSAGQKQRLLIARAVYKDPAYLFFDEATNALDAHNERIIMQNLNQFFEGRTVVVVAHRLSTVKNADQIIVLEKGRILERGTHQELVDLNGAYLHLVKNQLELGK